MILLFLIKGLALLKTNQKLKISILKCQKVASAPVKFIEYASLTCPACAAFHTNVYPKLNKEYIETGKIQFIHREIYFDRAGLWAA